MKIAPLLLFGLCACELEPLTVYLANDAPEHAADEVRAAGAILGLDIEVHPSRGITPSGIYLETQNELWDGYAGRALFRTECYAVIRALPDRGVIAHEIGHALGLEHLERFDNMMHPTHMGLELEPWQQEIVDENAEAMRKCR